MAKLFNLGTDGRGNFKRDLGYPQHRFYLGRDRAEATQRVLQLERLWSLVETRWQAKRQTERPEWDEVALTIARALARGDDEAEIPVPPEASQPLAALLWLREWETVYPLLRLKLPAQYAARLDEDRQQIERTAEIETRLFGKPSKGMSHLLARPAQSLHVALEEYAAHVRQKYTKDGSVTEYGVVTLKLLDMLKGHVEDRPLVQLDAGALDFWQRYWERRPMGKRGRLATRTCVNVLKVQRSFLAWLDRQRKYEWRIPADYERRKIMVEVTQAERAARVGQTVKVYTVEELATLYEYALPWERALLLLALNCGFSRAEIATLLLSEIHLDSEHPHYHKMGNWIMRLRKKSDVYGEWRLWPETVAAIRFLQRTRPKNDRPELLLNKAGEPFWKPSEAGNPNQQIPNMWQRLIKRVRKDQPGFKALPYKYLRKTASTLMRRIAGGEVASMFLAHGRATGDELLVIYAQRPFAKVFRALKILRRKFAPLFAKVPDPFPADGVPETRPEISLGKIRRIKELRAQGFKVCHICRELGVSRTTVYRYTQKAQQAT
jgi:integrase